VRISRKEVRHVAELSRIELGPEEEETFLSQLDDILTYMDQLNELNTDDVEIVFHTWGLANVMRRDEPRPSLPREDALANAPERTRDAYKVPRVIE